MSRLLGIRQSLWRTIFGSSRRISRSVHVYRSRPLQLDILEDRRLLAVSAAWSDGTLTVTGDNDLSGDDIEITVSGGNVSVTDYGVPVSISGGPVVPGNVEAILVNGNNGPDTIDLANVTTGNGFLAAYLNDPTTPNKDVRVNGGAGDDTLLGSPFEDELDGAVDDDVIQGRDGDDRLLGGDDDDTIDGNAGDDFVDGGDNQDLIHGNDGNDDLNGDDSDDEIYGDAGDDVLHGNDGDDELYGGAGNDRLEGGEDNASCLGGTCNAAQAAVIGNWTDGDALAGGTGDDNYEFDFDNGTPQGMDRITEATSEGVDALDFTEWRQFIKVSLAEGNVQNVTWLSGLNPDKIFIWLSSTTQFENVYADADPDQDNLNVDGTLGTNYQQGGGVTGNTITGNSADNLLVCHGALQNRPVWGALESAGVVVGYGG